MSLSLRRATLEDAMDLFRWRNDEKTRESSFTKEKINIPEHLEWYKKKMADESCQLFILMDGDEKAGNIRLDCREAFGEISYMIAPDKRGKGYGKMILSLVEKNAPEGIKTLLGFTLPDNEVSQKCFRANGYSEFAVGDIRCFIKML